MQPTCFGRSVRIDKIKDSSLPSYLDDKGADMTDASKVLVAISKCDDPGRLRTFIKNAQNKHENGIADAAFRRLISLVPSEEFGSVEHDFWQTVNAFEYALSEERGKTTRLARTRQKVGRVGVIETLKDWALSDKKTKGFEMLLERGMPELTGEAIVLRHPDKFDQNVRDAARARLTDAGVDINSLPIPVAASRQAT